MKISYLGKHRCRLRYMPQFINHLTDTDKPYFGFAFLNLLIWVDV